MTEPKKKAAATSLRLPADLLERADALIPLMSELGAASSTGELNRSDVLRIALTRGLAQLEQQQANKQKRRR